MFCDNFKQVDKRWLITGEGTMFKPVVKSEEHTSVHSSILTKRKQNANKTL